MNEAMHREMMERTEDVPGTMMYHNWMRAMLRLNDRDCRTVLSAIWRLSEFGEMPEEEVMEGPVGSVLELMIDKVHFDHKRYRQRVEAGRKGGRRSAEARRRRQEEAGGLQAESSSVRQETGGGPADMGDWIPPTDMDAPPEAFAPQEACEGKQYASKTKQYASKIKQNQPTIIPTVTPTVIPTVIPTVTPAAITATAAASTSAAASASAVSPVSLYSDDSTDLFTSILNEEEEFPPTREMVVDYLREKNAESIVDADEFLERCREAGWTDGKGRPVRNWRMWLKGYLTKQQIAAAKVRCAPDPRIAELERLKQKYLREEAEQR